MIAALLIPMGVLGDRIGRRKLLLIGAAAFAVGSVVAACSPTPEALILTSLAAPRLAHRFGAGRVVAVSLVVAAAGYAIVPSALVVGMVVLYVGQGPVMALSTDLIVGAAPEEKAGAAAALSETGLEFGLATGIAVFGTLGAVTGFGAVAVVAAVVSVLLAVPARLT